MTPYKKTLDTWLSLRDLSLRELLAHLGIREAAVKHDASYGRLTGLTLVHDGQANPAYCYFKAGRFVALFVDGCDALADMEPQQLRGDLGEPAAALRSRAGKRFKLYVYPQQGIAFAATSSAVCFLEIFPKTTLDHYLARFYEDPGPFIE